ALGKRPSRGVGRLAMAELSLGVPGLLRDCVDGQARARLKAATPAEAIDSMITSYPRLKVHVFDESGAGRGHVFLAFDGRQLRRDQVDREPRGGDRLDVVQAVSGGRAG